MNAPGVGIMCKGERLEYLLEYHDHHPLVHLPLCIQLLLSSITALDWKWQQSNHYDAVG